MGVRPGFGSGFWIFGFFGVVRFRFWAGVLGGRKNDENLGRTGH